jgi:hypothetical protein
MKVFLIAAVAVAVSGAAFAEDLKGSVMTDAEMDKVTAGDVPLCLGTGCGLMTAGVASGGKVSPQGIPQAINRTGMCVGLGTATRGSSC